MTRLIDADYCIAQIKEYYCTGCDNYKGVRCRACLFDDAMNVIDSIPTVNEWIPVSERLPEKHDEYYVTWKYNYYDKRYVGIFEFTDEEGFIPDMMLGNRGYIEVIAWMPLPRKYEKEVE